MSDTIKLQESIAQQQEQSGVFDFGKPFEELTDVELRIIVNHLKDMFNTLFKSMQVMQQIQKDNLETITQLVENSNSLDEFKKEVTSFFASIVEYNKITDKRLDMHSDLLNQITGI